MNIVPHKSLVELQIIQISCFIEMFSLAQHHLNIDIETSNAHFDHVSELLAFLRFSMITEENIGKLTSNILENHYLERKKRLMSSIVETTQIFLLLPSLEGIEKILAILEEWKITSQELFININELGDGNIYYVRCI